MVDFARAAELARRKVSDTFDIFQLRLKPMARGADVNARAMEDIGRAGFAFRGFIDLGPSQDAIPRHLPADPGVRGSSVSYDAVLTALTSGWPCQARKGDRVIVVAAPVSSLVEAGSEWEIMAGENDGTPRQAFYLNRRKI